MGVRSVAYADPASVVHKSAYDSAMRTPPLAARCEAHAFVVAEALGHDLAAILRSLTGGRHMSHARISIDPAVMMGKPCIKGTRIAVDLILRKLGAGRSFADLLEAYPNLTEDDVRAALAFAADYMQHETVLAAE